MNGEFTKPPKTKASANDLLSDIAARISEIAGSDISEEKAKKGARRFAQFCQKLIDIEIRIETDKEQDRESEKQKNQ